MKPLIELRHCDVILNQQPILHDVSWVLQRGENWAFRGGNGAGKSTLLQLVRGAIWPHYARGTRCYRFGDVETASPIRAREQIAFVSGAQHQQYRRQEWMLRGRDIVISGFFRSELLHQKPTETQCGQTETLARQLGLSALLERDYHTLSHGELRRLLIARALVTQPRVLVLDEACSGLDAESRAQMLEFIETLATREVQILTATHRRDEIVPSISHLAHLENGRIVSQGRRARVLPAHTPNNEYSMHSAAFARAHSERRAQSFSTLIQIETADVFRDESCVLHHVSWTWKHGQHWRVRGANGSGKSTFLKLIAGELWPALGGKITRFDDAHFDDIWQMKRHIGVVSPELQERYEDDVTGFDVVASGFFGFIGVSENLTDKHCDMVEQTLQSCGIENLRDKLITQMSSGEARKTLLARALVNRPDVLLLDEPFDSLDERTSADYKRLLGLAVENGAHVLLVSHHDEDVLAFLTNEIFFDDGRITGHKAI